MEAGVARAIDSVGSVFTMDIIMQVSAVEIDVDKLELPDFGAILHA
jgi:hypothetical protein